MAMPWALLGGDHVSAADAAFGMNVFVISALAHDVPMKQTLSWRGVVFLG
mgnify:FL=1|jgi:hypothetical protein